MHTCTSWMFLRLLMPALHGRFRGLAASPEAVSSILAIGLFLVQPRHRNELQDVSIEWSLSDCYMFFATFIIVNTHSWKVWLCLDRLAFTMIYKYHKKCCRACQRQPRTLLTCCDMRLKLRRNGSPVASLTLTGKSKSSWRTVFPPNLPTPCNQAREWVLYFLKVVDRSVLGHIRHKFASLQLYQDVGTRTHKAVPPIHTLVNKPFNYSYIFHNW